MPEQHQFDHLSGELQPGDTGWLPLDMDGNPSGPATVDPPPPSPELRACAVSLTHDGHLVSSAGAVLEPPLNSNVDRRTGTTVPPPVETPVLSYLAPATAVIGSPDFTLMCVGSGFNFASVIVFNGGDEPTTFVDENSVSTVVKPSLVGTPISVPVYVRNAGLVSESRDFEFEADLTQSGSARRRL